MHETAKATQMLVAMQAKYQTMENTMGIKKKVNVECKSVCAMPSSWYYDFQHLVDCCQENQGWVVKMANVQININLDADLWSEMLCCRRDWLTR